MTMGGRGGEGDPAKISDGHPRRYGTFPPPASPAPLPPQPPVSLLYRHNRQLGAACHAIPVGPPLPFWGIGIGWALFLSGFFLAAIPWYVGVFIQLFVALDYREKPGLVACTVAAALTLIPIILHAFYFHVFW